MADVLYELRGVRVEYPTSAGVVTALDEVGVDVPADGVTTFAGPSGSGKSTLLRVLGLIETPTAGAVALRGRDIGALSVRERRAVRRTQVALVWQNPMDNLLDTLTVGDNLRAAAQSADRSVDRSASRQSTVDTRSADVDEVLDRLGIAGTALWPVGALSGGQQQRLAFGCALLRRPTVVLADEPTSQLDAASAARVLEVVAMLTADGIGVVVASHDDAVIAASSTVIRLHNGRIR